MRISGTLKTRGRLYRPTSTSSVNCSSSRENCDAFRWKWTRLPLLKRLLWKNLRWTVDVQHGWTLSCRTLSSHREWFLQWRPFHSWISATWVRCVSVRRLRYQSATSERSSWQRTVRRQSSAVHRRVVLSYGWARSTSTVDWSDLSAVPREIVNLSYSHWTAAAGRWNALWRGREALRYRQQYNMHRMLVLRRTRAQDVTLPSWVVSQTVKIAQQLPQRQQWTARLKQQTSSSLSTLSSKYCKTRQTDVISSSAMWSYEVCVTRAFCDQIKWYRMQCRAYCWGNRGGRLG